MAKFKNSFSRSWDDEHEPSSILLICHMNTCLTDHGCISRHLVPVHESRTRKVLIMKHVASRLSIDSLETTRNG